MIASRTHLLLWTVCAACSGGDDPVALDATPPPQDAAPVDTRVAVTCELTAVIEDVRAMHGTSQPITRAHGAVTCDGAATIQVEICMESRNADATTWSDAIGCASLSRSSVMELDAEHTVNLAGYCFGDKVFRAKATATIDGSMLPVVTSTELASATICGA